MAKRGSQRASTPAGGRAGSAGSAAARRKSAAFRAAEAARLRRRRRFTWIGSVLVVAAVIAAIVGVALTRSHNNGAGGSSDVAGSVLTGPIGPEGIVLEQGTVLAPASTAATGQTVDGVQCNSTEQAVYHIHTHLTVYVDGALRPIPAGIGVVEPVAQQGAHGVFDEASHCYYWLHTHAQDGIIHVEAPSHVTYTLGQFFAIWHQPLGPDQVGPAHGTLVVFVDGTRYRGNPDAITLTSREDIQIDVGPPAVPAHRVDWSASQL
jgi:hypothetical protein